MTAKTTRAGRSAIEHHDRLAELLKRLTPTVLADLDQRGRFITKPDGYGCGQVEPGAIHGSDISRPTEQAAIARQEPFAPDPVGEQIRLIFGALAEAAGVLEPAARWLDYLNAYGDRAIVRESSLAGDCKACTRPIAGGSRDPIRNGYCNACRMAYARWSEEHPVADDPAAHRAAFEHERPTWTPAPERMTACGHLCCARTTTHEHVNAAGVVFPDDCSACRSLVAHGTSE